ncbi:hypothetical protein AB9K26_13050 [Psychroserpens sp. XS_ASV72]|uniref:hypothetical protein n=1 Tax=Psychroserpens sp. XS_ASV72 TaxID=3241293 RepID=UPI00351115FB
MKVFTIIVTIVALGLIGFNISQIDWNAPFEGQSVIALITILAALCAIILLQVLRLSKRVDEKLKEKR